MPLPRAGLVCALALLLSLLPSGGAAVRDDKAGGPAHLQVVVSIYPLALIVGELGGQRVSVSTLLATGADPHSFEATPAAVVRGARADLAVLVGGELDAWARPLLSQRHGIRQVALLEVEGLTPLGGSDSDHHDPHFWLDPIRVRDVVAPALSALMADLDPDGRDYYEKRRQEFSTALTQLDERIRQQLSTLGSRQYVALHPGWLYFADRYGLTELGTVKHSPGKATTPRDLAELIRAGRRTGIATVLIEPQLDRRMARVVAAELEAATVMVDPLGTPRDPNRSNYLGLLSFNADAFARALSKGGPRP
ncbi:MAG: metal ABC transporter substrate-binding protein [Deltaproteobacteria bacterium]